MHPSSFSPAALVVVLVAGSGLVALALLHGWRQRARENAARPSSPPDEPVTERAPDAPTALAANAPDSDPPRTSASARAERLRNLLLSRMSHDLRNPLNSVVTLSQLMAEGDAGALSLEQRRYVEVIHRSGRTALALFDDILDLAALESGSLELDLGLVDMTTLARSIAERCSRLARDKGIPLQVNAPPRSVVVQTDEDRLRQIVQRLVEHAVVETRHGYVEIAVAADGDGGGDHGQALLRVHDTGEDLSDTTRRALAIDSDAVEDFDALVLGEGVFAARDRGVLPLLVVGRLAKLMALRLGVRAEQGEGVSFELRLPTVAGEVERPATTRGGGRRVLLIEDDEMERQRVAGVLESAGYTITMTGSGQEGLALLHDAHFDAVVLDLVMPGMTGLDVLRAAQRDDHLGDMPFVVLSALYMTKSERAVLGPRVAEVVRKGEATTEELTAALARALKGREAGAGAVAGAPPQVT